MDAHTAQVQAAVQQLVMEHGEYAPLELLLATNRLGYDDYRAWRECRLETLDAVLADGKREIFAWLEGAQSWACALGLAAEPAVHHGWEENAGTVLVASSDPRLNELLSTRFRHTREHDQLDLFIDSAQTAAVTIDRLLYFTAHVFGVSDRGAPARQHAYLSALRTLPEVEVHFGSFLAKTVWRPLTNLPVVGRRIDTPQPMTLPAGNHPVAGANSQTLPVGSYPERGARRKKRRKAAAPLPDALVAEFHAVEEKGSDVNLAAHLLNDAWKGLFDAAAVISNDTDLVTPIRMVTGERGKTVFIVRPGRWQVSPKPSQAASHVRHVRTAMLKAAQLPDTLPGNGISKPAGW